MSSPWRPGDGQHFLARSSFFHEARVGTGPCWPSAEGCVGQSWQLAGHAWTGGCCRWAAAIGCCSDSSLQGSRQRPQPHQALQVAGGWTEDVKLGELWCGSQQPSCCRQRLWLPGNKSFCTHCCTRSLAAQSRLAQHCRGRGRPLIPQAQIPPSRGAWCPWCSPV